MLLEVTDLRASYGRFDVLNGISVRVAEGEVVCIIGPNGAGKSTLLKAIAGFLRPRTGSVRFRGEEIAGLSPVAVLKRGICYVFQRSSIFPKMTVWENLLMGAYTREDGRPRIRQDIDEVCRLFPVLGEKRAVKAEALSGGMRRMLEVGRALLLDPALLLLDEPTMGLAPKVMDDLFAKVMQINARGTAIVIVEQNARKALRLAQRAYVLEGGTTRLEGQGVELLNDPEVRKAYLGG
jgi:ABC-type branched-subunit amino acid transport system ATPase component